MIVIVLTSGLSNRMRAIDSAISLSAYLDRPLKIVWVKNKAMRIGFTDLFKPISSATIHETAFPPLKMSRSVPWNLYIPGLLRRISGAKYFDKKEMRQLQSEQSKLLELVSREKEVVLCGGYRFFENEKMYEEFEPLDDLKKRIDEETKDFLDSTFGVHIRRTDNTKAINESPVELFEKAIRKELQSGAESFYLASDSVEVKDRIKRTFGKQCIMNDFIPSRGNKIDIQQGLVELYTLSRTTKVYGSYWSSFSHTACHLTGIEEITVRKHNTPKSLAH